MQSVQHFIASAEAFFSFWLQPTLANQAWFFLFLFLIFLNVNFFVQKTLASHSLVEFKELTSRKDLSSLKKHVQELWLIFTGLQL